MVYIIGFKAKNLMYEKEVTSVSSEIMFYLRNQRSKFIMLISY